jgi:drug/metabolite transporter (DMT)-like permease
VIIPFLASMTYGLGIIVDKIALSKRKIALSSYIPYLFLYLCFFSALVTPFFGQIDWEYLFNAHRDPLPLFLFLLMILLAITWNIFYYESLAKEELYEFETITMLAPIVTIGLSWIFLPEKWNIHIGIAAIVATGALIWSHWEKHHITLSHYSMNLIMAVFLMAMEDIIVTSLLSYQIFSPVSLYAVRTLVLFIFFFAYYKPKGDARVHQKNSSIIAFSGLLGAITMILKYYGYVTVGIPFTVLVIVVAPITIYVASALVLHERMRVKTLIATLIIALSVIYATALIPLQ